ncbi:hypothetical protein C8F04DRAFT_1182854 [Mycena alexandri]|uniref:Uncharacterized protein n=1 Tax=Mycena alexandri TaxID=1745969 RepID=A0AAD6X328_9AGAR|nr:hypothetical protein C8F04DRAFT_1182854 [Mycena alexandri]
MIAWSGLLDWQKSFPEEKMRDCVGGEGWEEEELNVMLLSAAGFAAAHQPVPFVVEYDWYYPPAILREKDFISNSVFKFSMLTPVEQVETQRYSTLSPLVDSEKLTAMFDFSATRQI